MTRSFIHRAKYAVCPASPAHGPTPIEIQRWEDDGGAVLPDTAPGATSADHDFGGPVGELDAAE